MVIVMAFELLCEYCDLFLSWKLKKSSQALNNIKILDKYISINKEWLFKV